MAKLESGAQSALGGVEERMRRSLNLAGLISAAFEAEARPVQIIDDAMRPGCNVWRGRNWSGDGAVTIPASGGGATAVAIKANNDILVTKVIVCATDALPRTIQSVLAQIQIFGSGTASPGAFVTAFGVFTELLTQITERPPIVANVGAALTATGANIRNMRFQPGESLEIPVLVHLQIGGILACFLTNESGVVTAAANVTFEGKVF